MYSLSSSTDAMFLCFHFFCFNLLFSGFEFCTSSFSISQDGMGGRGQTHVNDMQPVSHVCLHRIQHLVISESARLSC